MDADGDTLNIYTELRIARLLCSRSVRSLLDWLDANGSWNAASERRL